MGYKFDNTSGPGHSPFRTSCCNGTATGNKLKITAIKQIGIIMTDQLTLSADERKTAAVF
jgi:hypothetical protein